MPTVPPPSLPPPVRARRHTLTRRSRDERRAIRVGIVGTILAHLLFLWLAPLMERHFFADVSELMPANPDAARDFEIEIAPDEFEPEPPPQRFVEVNPDAPDNPPDVTDNFGARNQQLAQETPAEEEGDMPSTEGQDEIESTAIVTGTRAPALTPVEVAPPPQEETEPNDVTEPAEAPRLAQDPLSGLEDISGDNPEGIGSNVVRLPENPQADVTERVEGVQDPEVAQPDGTGLYFRPDPNRPRPRPTLPGAPNRPTFLVNRATGTKNVGVIAHNALRTTYGDYLQRIIDVVDAEWNLAILDRFQRRFAFPSSGSKVEVTFMLNKEGKVSIKKVDGNAGTFWDGVAVEAIAAPARQSTGYGKWPEDMIAILGEETELTFTFHYM